MMEAYDDTMKFLNTLLSVLKDRSSRKNLNIMLEKINSIHDRLINNRFARDKRKNSERVLVSILADCSREGKCTLPHYTSGGCENRGKQYCSHREIDELSLDNARKDIRFFDDVIRDDEKNLEECCNTVHKIFYPTQIV